MSLSFDSIKGWLHSYFRTQRLEFFVSQYPNLSMLSVLDVGGTPGMWEILKERFDIVPKRIVLLNKFNQKESNCSYECVMGDARHLPYSDKSFDLVFSNSVIEHVGNEADRLKFARECERVGKEIYIQTPNRWFPIEPHILTIFIHWLPRPLYKKLSFLSVMFIVQILKIKPNVNVIQWADNANLLSRKQLQELFSNKMIIEEKVFGLIKSFIVTS
jgi:SAM-dependent methyltransferase